MPRAKAFSILIRLARRNFGSTIFFLDAPRAWIQGPGFTIEGPSRSHPPNRYRYSSQKGGGGQILSNKFRAKDRFTGRQAAGGSGGRCPHWFVSDDDPRNQIEIGSSLASIKEACI